MKEQSSSRISAWLVRLLATGSITVALACTSTAGAVEAPDFSLIDLRNHNHELQRVGGSAVVLFFTGTGCPIARKSAPKLRDLQERYRKDRVNFWIINSYPGDSARDCRKECGELGLWGITYLRDPNQAVALAFGVERTAEVVAIETKNWQVFYRGAIDDQFGEGAERATPQNRYLENALGEFLKGQPVTTPSTKPHGCLFSYAKHDDVPSYSTEIAPLLQRHCVECHRDGGIGPWAMSSHKRVRNYAKMIEEVLLTRRMPPWDANPDYGHFSNAHTLTREETQTLLRWVQADAPGGDGPDPLEAPLPAIQEWPLGKPDMVLRLPEPQQIPATGVLEYRHIPIPWPMTNDVWLAGTDVKPGNRKVVHHVILYAKWPGCRDDGTGNGQHLCGWAPGTPPTRFPDGVAERLPAGAELNAEVHYTTCGSAQTDQSEIAFYLAPGPQPREVEIRRAAEFDLNIPPGSDESRHVATYAFKKSATLYRLMPHMHLRGKWMRYELLLPNGTQETLLDVPRYDFNWQLSYTLAEPRHVPAGAWLLVTGAFDNSPGNLSNPDPQKRVGFGLQSWDEMFIGFFEAADDPIGSPALSGGGNQKPVHTKPPADRS